MKSGRRPKVVGEMVEMESRPGRPFIVHARWYLMYKHSLSGEFSRIWSLAPTVTRFGLKKVNRHVHGHVSTRKSFTDARWHSNSVSFTHTSHSDQLGSMGQPPQPVHTNGEIGVRTGLTDLTFVHAFILIRPLLRSRWTQTRSAAPPLAPLPIVFASVGTAARAALEQLHAQK